MTLRHHRHPKKIPLRVVNLSLILIVLMGTMTGCLTNNKYRRQGYCNGYELRNYSIKQGSGMHIHGRVRICDTRKIASFAKIRFVSDSGAIYEAIANKKGYYEINLPGWYFVGKIVASNHSRGHSGRITIEDIFFGHTNACELNINLYNTNNFYNEVELLKNDIIWIRENNKEQ